MRRWAAAARRIGGLCAILLALWAPMAALAQTSGLLDPTLRPAVPQGATDPRLCQWRWTEGGGFGLWTETCRFPSGLWQVNWAPDQGAFVLTRDGQPEAAVLRPWPLRQGAAPDRLLPGLQAAGLVPAGTDCRFAPAALGPMPRTRAAFVLRPPAPETPEGKTPQPAPAGGSGGGSGGYSGGVATDVPPPPCGALGISTHAHRYALRDLRWPDAIVFVDAGQEGNQIAPQTLTPLPEGAVSPDAVPSDAVPMAAAAAILARFAADCTDLGGGALQIGPEAVRRLLPGREGAWLIDGAALHCPGAATLACGGTGGCAMVLLSAGGAAREVLAKGWQMTRMADTPVLLLQVHGSDCGGTNLRRCLRAVVLSEDGFRSPGWD